VTDGPKASPAEAILDQRVLGEDVTLSIRQVAEATGLSRERIQRLWVASGLRWTGLDDDEPVFAESDLATFASFAAGSALFGDDAAYHFTQTMGVACARIGQAAVEVFLVHVAEDLRGASEEEQVAAYEVAALAFNTLPPVLERLFRLHSQRAVDRWRVQRDADLPFDVQSLAVGFVDLVGFTESTEDISPHELAELVGQFETGAHAAVTSHGGEVVKLIGDEVMFVADTATDACEVALALFAAFAEAGVTPRGGIALGPIVVRSGDYYGPTVNLAARLAAAAAPDEVLVTEAVRAGAGERTAARLEPAGRRVLKGFADAVLTFSLTGG
jgi:adenylate cyclase